MAEKMRLIGSLGEIEASVGDEFELLFPSDGRWQIVEFTDARIYSPSGFGGCPTVWCRAVGDVPERWREYQREDGCVEFCGDSIASALLRALAQEEDHAG